MAGDYLTLNEAAAKNMISYKISGNESSTHYLKPVKLIVKNLRNEELKLIIKLGTIITPDDSEYQNIIVTKEELICLSPLKEKVFEIYGMCTEPGDIAPDISAVYRFENKINEKLLPLLRLIQAKKYYKPEGQYAVWAAYEKRPLKYICGYDTVAEKELVNIVAEITNQPIPVRNNNENYLTNYYNNQIKLKIGGNFDYKLSQEKSLSIAMFDKNNVIVRELYKNDHVCAGTHHFDYYFDASVYTDDYYFIRLIINDEIKLNLKVEIPR